MLELRTVTYEDADKEYEFTSQMPYDENGFIYEWCGTKREDFDSVIRSMTDAQNGIGLPEGYVPETVYFLWDADEIVGMFRFRHYLCPSLVKGAGHIGYYIGEKYRGKGYATKGLRLLMELTRDNLREDEFYLRADKDNVASQKVMLANGGYVWHSDEDKVYLRIKK